jgi:4-amino-4-deoxy-L-arabinose transferase-like glycosyltransferase
MSESAVPATLLGRQNTHTRNLIVLWSLGLLYVALTWFLSHPAHSDEPGYLSLAYGIVGRHWPGAHVPSLWWGPGLPLILAPLVLAHVPLDVMRLLEPVLLTCSVVLFYSLLRLYVPERMAFLTSAALGVYLPIYQLLRALGSDIPALFLIVVFMYALTRDTREPRWRYFLVASAAAAYLALTRIVFGWVLLGALVFWAGAWLWSRRRATARIAAVHALALVLCGPWLAHTYAVSHKVFYWGSSGGLSLYWMASPYPGQLGDWHAPTDVRSMPILAPNRPDFAPIPGANQVRVDSERQHQAIRYIRAHPTRYVRNLVNNFSRLWFNIPYTSTAEHIGTLLYVVPNALLFAGALFALVMLRRGWSEVPLSLRAFLVLAVLGIGVQTLVAAYSRMLVPLVPVILLFIAWSLDRYRRLEPPPTVV